MIEEAYVVIHEVLGSSTAWLLAQLTVGAVLLGGIYALIASGFTIIFGILKILNVAHGEFVVLGAYVAYWIFSLLGFDPLLSLLLVVPIGALYGLIAYKLVLEGVSRGGVEPTIVASFGIMLILQTSMMAAWTADPRSIVTSFTGSSILAGGIVIPLARLTAFLISLASLITISVFLKFTYVGKAIRAVSQDPEASSMLGIPVGRVKVLGFTLGSLMASLSGGLLGTISSFTPTMGPELLLKSFVVLAMVGFGGVAQVVAGGIILAMAETFGSLVLGSGLRNVVSYGLLIAVLLARPMGLFAKKEEREV
jgi:branched-chain amino acid transport system permease protein